MRSFGARSLAEARAEVAAVARDRVGADAVVETAVDCRYVGQSHEITVASPADFQREHERRNGHARPGAPVEVVAVRARATAAAPLDVADLPAVERARRARSGSRRGTRLHRVDPGRLGGGTPRPRRLGPHPH